MNALMTFEYMYPKRLCYICCYCGKTFYAPMVDSHDDREARRQVSVLPRNWFRCGCNTSAKALEKWHKSGSHRFFIEFGDIELRPDGKLRFFIIDPLTGNHSGGILE